MAEFNNQGGDGGGESQLGRGGGSAVENPYADVLADTYGPPKGSSEQSSQSAGSEVKGTQGSQAPERADAPAESSTKAGETQKPDLQAPAEDLMKGAAQGQDSALDKFGQAAEDGAKAFKEGAENGPSSAMQDNQGHAKEMERQGLDPSKMEPDTFPATAGTDQMIEDMKRRGVAPAEPDKVTNDLKQFQESPKYQDPEIITDGDPSQFRSKEPSSLKRLDGVESAGESENPDSGLNTLPDELKGSSPLDALRQYPEIGKDIVVSPKDLSKPEGQGVQGGGPAETNKGENSPPFPSMEQILEEAGKRGAPSGGRHDTIAPLLPPDEGLDSSGTKPEQEKPALDPTQNNIDHFKDGVITVPEMESNVVQTSDKSGSAQGRPEKGLPATGSELQMRDGQLKGVMTMPSEGASQLHEPSHVDKKPNPVEEQLKKIRNTSFKYDDVKF